MPNFNIPGKLKPSVGKIIADSENISYESTNVKEKLSEVNTELEEIKNVNNDLSAKIETNKNEANSAINALSNSLKVKEIDSIDLDSEELNETGIYSIKNATSLPKAETVKVGKLTSNKTKDGTFQEWSSEDCFATRFRQYKEIEENTITVNGEVPTNNSSKSTLVSSTLSLKAGGEYILSGYLNGNISIDGTDFNETTGKTVLIFNNVFIDSNSENVIFYNLSSKSLKIVLAENSINYIQSKTETQPETLIDKSGIIHSSNNLEITGPGCLAIRSNFRNHGIYANEIKITGKPNIYISCKYSSNDLNGHDGIHPGKSLFVENGNFEICNCNDGIGLGSSNTGINRIYAGHFNIHDFAVGQNSIDGSKLEEYDGEGEKSDIAKVCYIYKTEHFSMNEEAINAVSGNVIFLDKNNWNNYFTKKITKKINDALETDITTTFTGTLESGEYTISGYFDSITVNGKADFNLENAYISSIAYTATSKNITVKSNDLNVYENTKAEGTELASKQFVSIVESLTSKSNIKLTGKGVLLCGNVNSALNDVETQGKLLIYGDGNKYIKTASAGKFYIGADDDQYDGKTAKKSNQNLFIDEITETGKVKPGKEGSSIYIQQHGDLYIGRMNLAIDDLKRNKEPYIGTTEAENINIPEGSEYVEAVYKKDILTTELNGNLAQVKILNEIANYKSFKKPSVLDSRWFILSEEKSVDASLKTFSSYDEAISNISLLDLGEVVSIKSADTSEYIDDYNIYIVVASGTGKELKEIKQGGDSGNTGTLDFAVVDVSGYQSLSDGIYECAVGDTIQFKYTFESSNYSNVPGKVFGTVNGNIVYTNSFYPDGSIQYTWDYSTTGLKPGTYKIVLYGKESTGRISNRVSYTFQIGGLNLSTSFEDGTVVQINSPLTIPLKIEAADETSEIHLKVSIDGSEISNSIVTTKTTSFILEKENIQTGGIKNISMKLENNKGKFSNELKFSIIAAEENIVYILTDKDQYEISDGAIVKIHARTIQLGYKDAKYITDILVKNSSNSTIYSNTVQCNYGLNEIDLTNLRFSIVDGRNESNINYSSYTATITVHSPNNQTESSTKNITVLVYENEYNIEPYIGENLICAYSAAGKSNSSVDRDSWDYTSSPNKTFKYDSSSSLDAPQPFKANFVNFNWDSNGWIRDEDGNTALKVNHGAYVELQNCTPFYYDYIDEPGGALTVSVDFKTKNILDSNAKVISCLFETTGDEEKTYYLRDRFGDYVKADENGSLKRELCYTDSTKTEVRLVSDGEEVADDLVFNYDKNVYYGVTASGDRDTSVISLTESIYSYSFKFNNIIRYFMNAGGYCWVNGVDYGTGNNETIYEITMVINERTTNYNHGDANPAYNTDVNLGDIDYRKFTGTVTEEVTKQTGFYIDTENAVVSTSSSPSDVNDKFHLNFSENTRTHIDLIISRSEEVPYYFPSIIGYTNGVLSLMKDLNNTNDKFVSIGKTRSKCAIYIGAKVHYDENNEVIVEDTGDADIYNLRIYDKALTPEEILQNYASELSDLDEKKQFIINNGIGNEAIPQTLPRITLIGADLGNGRYSINDFIMQLSNTDSNKVADLKSIKEPAYVKYYDPVDESKSWVVSHVNENGETVTTDIIPIRLQFQGTSSMVYPCKNYKMKLYDPFIAKNGVIGHSTINGKTTYGKKWKVDIGNNIADSTICLKADFMNSAHNANTGSANFIAEYNNSITGTTPASEINQNIRTTIYGYPCLLYYKESQAETQEHFLGVYNCNLDKSDTDCFGLDKKVVGDSSHGNATYDFGQSQFIDDDFSDDILITAKKYNEKHSTSIAETITLNDIENGIVVEKPYTALVNPDNGAVVAAMSEKGYLRTINNDNIAAVYCSEVKANSGASGAGGFGNYSINSVASDMEIRYPDEGDMEDEEYDTYSKSVSNPISFKDFKRPYYYHFQRMIKWLKAVYESNDRNRFLAEIDKHFNRNYLMDYYLTFMLLGAVDSLGKNLMIGSWGPENHLFNAWIEDGKAYCQDADNNKIEDKYAFEYNGQWITPTKVYLNNNGVREYQFARDVDGKLLYYKESSYDRYERVYTNGKTKFAADDVTTTPGEWIWYPTFYDIDTIGGLDNAGQLIYDVDIELDEVMDDGTTVYNTSDSILWQSVKKFLGETDKDGNSLLSERWSIFSGKVNDMNVYQRLVERNFYQNEIAKIPAKYYNDDCFLKYIYEGPEAKKGSGAYLYCIHGSCYEQIKKWFRERIIYLDSYFAKIGTDNASLRSSYAFYDPNVDDSVDDYYLTYSSDGTYQDHYAALAKKYPDIYELRSDENGNYLVNKNNGIMVKPIVFEFKTYQPGYVGVRWFNNGKVHFVRVGRNKTAYLSGNIKTNSNQEIFIFGGSNIKEIGDLSQYNIQELNIANLSRLGKLILGNSAYTSVVNKIDGIGSEFLSEINIERCTNIKTLNLEKCTNLKKLNMTRSGVTSVSLPSGGSLEYISYPPSITNINLRNLTNLSNIITDSLTNLQSITISGCPLIQGSKERYNSTIWDIVQLARSLNTINVEAYGEVAPGTDGYFFPDKYYNYDTRKTIKGEIRYTGETIPKNYTKFVDSFPNLSISYPNITDASDMFANYKNLNCIDSISAYAGTDQYGQSKYVLLYYWTQRGDDDIWYSPETISKYESNTIYKETISYYQDRITGKYYRLLKLRDETDMNILREEIKNHISNFTKFTNISGMFRNMEILDYLDPDTFNNVDISEAETKEMFYGCTNLEYFETPNDTVKNKKITVYIDKKTGNEINEDSGIDINAGLADGTIDIINYYINPFKPKERLPFTEANSTSKYPKGMRIIGDKMFYNCKKAKIWIRKNSETKPQDKYNRINVSRSAFEYVCYDRTKESQDRGVTLERPVILVEDVDSDILKLTTAKDSYDNNLNPMKNPIANGKQDAEGNQLYFALNQYGERIPDYSSEKVRFESDAWLREVYFGITKIVHKVNLNDINISDDTLKAANSSSNGEVLISYAENLDGERILFKLYETDKIIQFNRFNGLNFISETVGALPLTSKYSNLTSIGIVVPKYDCLDESRPRFDMENTVYPIFMTDNTKSIFTIDRASVEIGEKLTFIYVNNSELIPANYFNSFKPQSTVSIRYDKNLKEIGENAFSNSKIREFRSATLLSDGSIIPTETLGDVKSGNASLEKIGNHAFSNLSNLKQIYLPDSITEIGEYVFSNCALEIVRYSVNATKFPEGIFNNCNTLTNINNIDNLVNIETIGDNAFSNCTNLLSFISYNKVDFNKFPKLTAIGDSAFYYCNKFISRNLTFIIPKNITRIGNAAFEMNPSGPLKAVARFNWMDDINGDEYSNLEIGSNAFYKLFPVIYDTSKADNLQTVWNENLYPNLYVPNVKSIGNGAFSLYSSDKPYTYCLMKNSEEEIGDGWVNYTDKIVYNYSSIASIEENGLIMTYILSNVNGNEAYLHHVEGTTVSFEIKNTISYNGNEYKLTQILKNAFNTLTNSTISEIIFNKDSKLKRIESGVLGTSLASIQMKLSDNEFIQDVIPDELEIMSGNNLSNNEWYKAIKNDRTTPRGSFITLGKYILGYKPASNEMECELNLVSAFRKFVLKDPAMTNDSKDTVYTYNGASFVNSEGNAYTFNDNETYIFNKQQYTYNSADNKFYLNGNINYPLELENYLKNCNIVYDNSLSYDNIGSHITSITFPNTFNEYYIYNKAFYGQTELTNISLPTNIIEIGTEAFFNVPLEKIFIPKSVKKIGSNAFNENSQNGSYGSLREVFIEDGANFTGTAFNINENEKTYTTTTTNTCNISFNTLHVPAEMPDFFNNNFSGFRKASQLKNLYLGTMAINDIEGDEHNGTIIWPNYPLYVGADGQATFEETETTLTDSNGKQLYCPRFYHDICIKANAYVTDTSLQTTKQYGYVPVGDFKSNLDISHVRQYRDITADPKYDYSPISVEQLLMILACFPTTGDRIYQITLSPDAAELTQVQSYLFSTLRGGKFKIIRTVDVIG